MIHEAPFFSVSYQSLRRIHRVGASPVLEATVIYPVLGLLEGKESSPATVRFNDTYRSVAEKLMAWAMDAPARAAEEAFRCMGGSAPYSFDRRTVACEISVICKSDGFGAPSSVLTVTRTLRISSRREEVAEQTLTALDEWDWPTLTLRSSRKKLSKRKIPSPPSA